MVPCKWLCLGSWFGMCFKIFIPIFTLFYWVVDLVWLDIPWFFTGVDFYIEINLVSIKSIYVILHIFRKKWFFGVSFGVFWLKYWTANVMLKKIFSSHWNLQILGLTFSKTIVMSVIFSLHFFDHSSI